ncbi:MAG: sugar transferase, partial [Acidimicrobiales bacterium]
MASKLEQTGAGTLTGVDRRDRTTRRESLSPLVSPSARPEGRRQPWRRRYVTVLLVADGLGATFGALIAQMLRFDTLKPTAEQTGVVIPYIGIALLLAPLWVLALALGGVYDHRRLGAGSEEYRRIFDSLVRLLAGVAIAALVLKLDLVRGFVALALPLATAFTLVLHHLARRWLCGRRAAGACVQRVLVVGHEHEAADLVRHLRAASHSGLSVVGACVPGCGPTLDVDGVGVPVMGGPDRVIDGLARCGADTVAVADHDTLRNG